MVCVHLCLRPLQVALKTSEEKAATLETQYKEEQVGRRRAPLWVLGYT
jgi:hypothetical protein